MNYKVGNNVTIKVMVVDDSAFMRKVISDQINNISEMLVCTTARSGEDALNKIPKFLPDLITLDIEMTGMNGLETLEQIKSHYDIPVIMISSHTGEEMTISCLEKGAMDFVEKPINLLKIEESFTDELASKIKSIVQTTELRSVQYTKKSDEKASFPTKISAIVIGASTGGPKALMQLIKAIPSNLKVPIFIVQHMPKGFTKSFSTRLDQEAKVKVIEAKQGEIIKPGVVYIAPGDYHMRIENQKILLTQEDKIHSVRPAVDPLFESASKIYRKQLVGIILTGMGNDGALGMKHISEAGGYTIAQDKDSSIVFGMPRRAIELDVIDEVLSLNQIEEKLNWMIKVRQ